MPPINIVKWTREEDLIMKEQVRIAILLQSLRCVTRLVDFSCLYATTLSTPHEVFWGSGHLAVTKVSEDSKLSL